MSRYLVVAWIVERMVLSSWAPMFEALFSAGCAYMSTVSVGGLSAVTSDRSWAGAAAVSVQVQGFGTPRSREEGLRSLGNQQPSDFAQDSQAWASSGTSWSQFHSTVTRPWSTSAKVAKMLTVTSISVGLQPVHLSTTVKSTLLLFLLARIFFPHKGLLLGLLPALTASNTRWETATILSLLEEVIPQAPNPGA